MIPFCFTSSCSLILLIYDVFSSSSFCNCFVVRSNFSCNELYSSVSSFCDFNFSKSFSSCIICEDFSFNSSLYWLELLFCSFNNCWYSLIFEDKSVILAAALSSSSDTDNCSFRVFSSSIFNISMAFLCSFSIWDLTRLFSSRNSFRLLSNSICCSLLIVASSFKYSWRWLSIVWVNWVQLDKDSS
jgi:hypothetical protein